MPRELKILVMMVVISALFHGFSFFGMDYYSRRVAQEKKVNQAPDTVKFQVRVKKQPQPQPEPKRTIVEVEQEPTKAPEEARFAAKQAHRAEKETRLADAFKSKPLANAGKKGQGGTSPKTVSSKAVEKPPAQKKALTNPPTSRDGQIASSRKSNKAPKDSIIEQRKHYESLLPSSPQELAMGKPDAGFFDDVDHDIEIGEKIDLNTSEYRFIGYFTGLRKAIQLVWTYPLQAQRKALQGEVGLEFAISEAGHASHIKVVKSSGYDILDQAIVDAIKLASPFSPLPPGIGKKRLVVKGSFRYVLSGYYPGGQ